MESNEFIPWAKPVLWGSEHEYVSEALTSTWISGGPYVKQFEEEIADYCGVKYALAASNGTTALHLTYLGAGLQPGDEVIIPGFAFLAAANITMHMGAKPVFAEVDPETWCLTAQAVEECITPKTRAVVPIHTYGNICEMDDILEIAGEKNLIVIEDAAEAFASRYKDRQAGSMGFMGLFSFHATKTITTGEGGMVLTNDELSYKKMALYRSHGMLRKRHYWHELPGYNFRLTNLQAALGCAQFKHIDKICRERKRIHSGYIENLTDIQGITLQRFNNTVDPVLWAFSVKLDSKAYPQGRDKVIEQLKAQNIETRPGFYVARSMDFYDCPRLPICEDISKQVISLPTYASLHNNQIQFISTELKRLRR